VEGGGKNQLARVLVVFQPSLHLSTGYTLSRSKNPQDQPRWTWIRCSNYQHYPLVLVTNVNSQMPLHQVSPVIHCTSHQADSQNY
jgi:hypothetical protein